MMSGSIVKLYMGVGDVIDYLRLVVFYGLLLVCMLCCVFISVLMMNIMMLILNMNELIVVSRFDVF